MIPKDQPIGNSPPKASFNQTIFMSHERQHDGQAILQQPKPLNGSGEQEIERTQAQDGQDVRRENNEWLARQGENGRHGIDRKYNIAHFDKQKNQ
jgi:hypothetical protein